ncbi:MAG TPA: pilus assembly protein PilM [Sedimentisphaerales bacterium]|nr:pilus assembly protein PilM [Sedimentisphaerales bacterium]
MISWPLKTRNPRPIGLDIGHDSIKMIQLSANAGHISVLAAARIPIDPNIDGDAERRSCVVSAIKQMLAQGRFHAREVVSCLPNEKLKITSVRLTETEPDQIEQALSKEVAQRFGLDPQKDAVNYMLAGNVRQGDEIKNELILLAADSESVRAHIELLEEAGLQPVGIDTLPCALFRSFQRSLQRQEDQQQTAVFVDIGGRFTTVVFGRGQEITFIKQIPTAGRDFDKEIAAKLGVTPKEAAVLRAKLRTERSDKGDFGLAEMTPPQTSDPPAQDRQSENPRDRDVLDPSTRQLMVDAISAVSERLAAEISLCFRYYTVTFRGKRVQRAAFSGGEAYEKILLNVLRRQLAVEVVVAQPLRGFDMTNLEFDSDKRGVLCEWAVAVGLALKGWNGQPKRSEACKSYERN